MSGVAAIERALDALARRRRRAKALAVVQAGTAAVGCWVLASALIDRWAAWPSAVRCATFAVTATTAAGVAIVAVRAWSCPDGRLALARTLEAEDPAWAERLLTVVSQQALPPALRGSKALNAALADDVAARLAARPPVVRRRRRAAGAAVVAAVAWAALWPVPGLDLGRLVARQLRPWASIAPVTGTHLELLPLARPVVAGRPVTIAARVSGLAASATLWVGPDAGHLHAVPMPAQPGGPAEATLPPVREDFVYRVIAGDAAAGPVAVGVVRRPGVDTLAVRLEFPPPTRRPPVTLSPSDGRLRVPAGTRVAVTLTATEPLKRAHLRVGGRTVDARRTTAGEWQATFVAEAAAAWSIHLTADNGLHGAGPAGMRIEVDPPATRPG